MQRLFEFVQHHYLLSGGALLAAIALILYELRARAQSFAALSAMQAVRLMNQGAIVLDLRNKEAFDAGHIGDAHSVPAAEIEARADSLKKWQNKAVIAYCDTGVSAAAAVRTLAKLGFTQVFNLQGGLDAWVKDNLPLTRTAGGAKAASK